MGSCVPGPQDSAKLKKTRTNLQNPIQQIVDKYSIQQLNDKWDSNQLKIIEGKVAALVNSPINFQRFLQIFPKILNFSQTTQKNYFKLFAFEGNNTISKRQLITALTIIKKVEGNDHLAPLIFYVYTSDYKHLSMTLEELERFQEENKAYAKNIENIDLEMSEKKDLSEVLMPIEAKKEQPKSNRSRINNIKTQGDLNKTANNNITIRDFKTIFQNYNLQSYQILFSWNIAQQEKELVQYVQKQGIRSKKGEKVYLVQYQWFLAWKNYVEQEYRIKIMYKDEENYQSVMSHKSINFKKSKQWSKSLHQNTKNEKPGEIKNFLLKYGKKDNQLNPNMVQNCNYICVKQQIWNKLVAIYNGGPSIERIYNKIYYNIIMKVKVNAQGRFVPQQSKKIQSKQKPTVSGYALGRQLKYLCYYKYPGKSNWIKLKDISTKSQDVFNSIKTYLVFIPKNAESYFIDQYNIHQTQDKKILHQRFKNYGNQINISVDGVLNRAQVVQIEDDQNITVEYIDEKGQSSRKTINYEILQKINPQNILKESLINQFSGLDNIGNTCYMNAVIQCLIRTPFFGGYLEHRNLDDKKQKEELLIQQISNIYMKSKRNNHQSINTKSFKRVFQKHCPYFEGNAQHDAQQFLICLLQRLIEQIKTSKQQYGVKQGNQSQKKSQQQKNMNKNVVKFFSGKTQAVTVCKKCKNKGLRSESFFTYSVSLPEQPVIQFFYHYIPYFKAQTNKSTVPIQCGITLGRKTTVGQFVKAVLKQRKLSKYKLALYSVFNNQILNKLEQSSFYKEISYYLHFNAKLVCFQVQHEESPVYHDFRQKKLSEKSIKIQLRQRIYSQKNKEYKTIYHPYILQITNKMYWKDVVEDIKTILYKLQTNQYQEILQENASNLVTNSKPFGISQIKITTSNLKHTVSLNNNPNQQQIHKTQSQLNKHKRASINQVPYGITPKHNLSNMDYKIRVIKSDHLYENNCVFCKDQFVTHKKSYIKKLCKGCTFNQQVALFEQADFRNISDNIIITIDWAKNIPQFQHSSKDSTYESCMQKKQNRKDTLEQLLKNNFQNHQELQLRCQKQSCKFDLAIRTQKISVYPNILLLHLKRFTYEDNMLVKLPNNVLYPQILELYSTKKQSYELYGVVTHYGSGVGGHYISFVKVSNKWYKCDDNRVTFSTNNQHIDPNAYILFYKKIEFQPSLIMLSF